MPAYLWITAAAAVAFVFWIALGRRWLHSVWYSWQAAAHVLADPLESHYAQVAEYGSMILAEERPLDLLPAPPVDPEPWHPDWREQTAADLSPEALRDEVRLPAYGGWISGPCLDDTGPGDDNFPSVASPSGPGQDWLGAQMALTFDWVRAMVPQVTGWSAA